MFDGHAAVKRQDIFGMKPEILVQRRFISFKIYRSTIVSALSKYPFCAYYARRMKKSLLNCLRGRRKSVLHYRDYVDDFYPHHDDQLNRALEDTAVDAWAYMLSSCENCPQQCLYDYEAKSPQFDKWKE
jgi:hypothetical protein